MQKKSTKYALAVATVSLALIGAGSAAAATGVTPGTGQHPTAYAFTASGYASHVVGGQAPAGSGKIAYQVIGCTNIAGLSKVNGEASATVNGIGTLTAARTRTWTTDAAGKTSTWASHKIAKVVFVRVPLLGTLSLSGVRSLSTAYHDATGYHAVSTSTLGSITVTLGGVPVNFPVPALGEILTIPGLAEISLGAGIQTSGAQGSMAYTDAVKVHLLPTDTTVYLAHSRATITGGVRSAVFHGSSAAAQATVAGAVTVGKTPLLVMRCAGTGGRVIHRDVASLGLDGLGSASGLATSERASQSDTTARSWQRADIAGVSLAGGELQVTGVTGRAAASYSTGGEVVTSTAGTTVASATLDGQPLDLPARGTLDLPGVATLATDVVTPRQGGVSVIALEVTLLDGSGAVIDLGAASTAITPSGL